MKIPKLFLLLLFLSFAKNSFACIPEFATSIMLPANQVDLIRLKKMIKYFHLPNLAQQQVMYRSRTDRNFLIELLLDKDPAGHIYGKLTIQDIKPEGFWGIVDPDSRKRALIKVAHEEINRLIQAKVLLNLSESDVKSIENLASSGHVIYHIDQGCPQAVKSISNEYNSSGSWIGIWGEITYALDAHGCVDANQAQMLRKNSLGGCSGEEIDPRFIGEFINR